MALSDAQRQARRRARLLENTRRLNRYEKALIKAVGLLKNGELNCRNPSLLVKETVALLEETLKKKVVSDE